MAKVNRLVLIVLFAFVSITAIPTFSQIRQYASIEELGAAFRENERQIDQKSQEIGLKKDQQVDKKDEIMAFEIPYLAAATEAANAYKAWIKMRDDPPTDMEPVIAAVEANKLKLLYDKKLQKFGQKDQELRNLKKQLENIIQSEQSAWKALRELWDKRLILLGQSEFYCPPCLKEIKVIRENPVTHNQDILYAKTWKPSKDFELLQMNIENQRLAIKAVEDMLTKAETDVDRRRKRFVDAYRAWNSTNNYYGSQFHSEAFFRITLEIVDVAVATKGGANLPAVMFEALWRVGYEGIYRYWYKGEGFKFPLPKLSDDYASYIQKLGGAVDSGRYVANANGRPGNVVDSLNYCDFFKDTASDVGGEIVKSGFGFAASTLYEARLQKKLAEGAGGWWSVVAAGRWDDAYKVYKEKGGDAFEGFTRLYKHLSSGENSYTDLLSRTLKEQDWKLSALKDLGISATVTVAKDIANEGMSQRRFQTYKTLAEYEVEWFITRNAYNRAMWFREQEKERLRDLMEELGKFYTKKMRNTYTFEPVLAQNLQIATTQAANNRMVSLVLTFNQPMQSDITVALNGQSKKGKPRYNRFASSNEGDAEVYELPLADLLADPENFDGGDLILTVYGQSDEGMVLDGDPSTQAVFLISSVSEGWKGYESRGVGDQTNTFSFVKPNVTISPSPIPPKPKDVPVEIAFQSVNSFSEDAAIAIFPSKEMMWRGRYKEFPHEVLKGRLVGNAKLNVSLEPGEYEVRLDDGFGDEAAVADLKVDFPSFVIRAKLKSIGKDKLATAELSIKAR